MKGMETAPELGSEREAEDYDVEDALILARLSSEIKAPKKGSLAYNRIVQAARDYMREVKRAEQPSSYRNEDGENYFRPKKRTSSSSDSERRKYHDQLAMMLFGTLRGSMPKSTADQISDFAAYLTGDEEYIGKW